MISPKFYSQITMCPRCQGWGTKAVPPVNTEKCSECSGHGVYVQQSSDLFAWDAPSFVDYKKRSNMILLKVLFIFTILFFVFMVLIVLKTLLQSIF